jgi:hypothetical protein
VRMRYSALLALVGLKWISVGIDLMFVRKTDNKTSLSRGRHLTKGIRVGLLDFDQT